MAESTKTTNPHRVRNGVLLILSPFLLLIGNIVLQVIVSRAGIHATFFDILSALAGMAGIVMLFVGPLLGIRMLDRR